MLKFLGNIPYVVYSLMKRLSHRSRAFIANADDIKGFTQSDHIKILQTEDGKNYEKAIKQQHAQMSDVFTALELLDRRLRELRFLGENYPSLLIYALEH